MDLPNIASVHDSTSNVTRKLAQFRPNFFLCIYYKLNSCITVELCICKQNQQVFLLWIPNSYLFIFLFQKQLNTLNKITSNILDIINSARDEWESEASKSNSLSSFEEKV